MNVPFSDNLQQFNADYLRLTKQVAESCRNHDLTDSMIIGTLYLITEHTSFYERYGWKYLCMVQGDDGEQMRMYISQHVRSSRSTDKGG